MARLLLRPKLSLITIDSSPSSGICITCVKLEYYAPGHWRDLEGEAPHAQRLGISYRHGVDEASLGREIKQAKENLEDKLRHKQCQATKLSQPGLMLLFIALYSFAAVSGDHRGPPLSATGKRRIQIRQEVCTFDCVAKFSAARITRRTPVHNWREPLGLALLMACDVPNEWSTSRFVRVKSNVRTKTAFRGAYK